MTYGSHCEECPLKGKGDISKPTGNPDARFMVVTDAPNFRPEAYGRLMSQSAMTLFAKSMAAEKFTKEDFSFHPYVRCPFDPDVYTTKEKSLITKSCRPYLTAAISEYAPEVIIPVGSEPSRQVFGHAVKITKVRGIATRSEEFPTPVILPMLNPVMAVMYPQHLPTVKSDCGSLGRLVDNGYDIEGAGREVLGEYEMIDDLQFLVDMHPSVISYDTENSGLSWFAPDAKLLTMQFSVQEGVAYLLPWDHPDKPQTSRAKVRLTRQLRELMCRDDVIVVGQNSKYDAVYTYAQTGVRYRIGGCTLMLATLVDENSMAKNLDDLARRYAPEIGGYADRFNATVDKSKMVELPLNQDFVDYGCLSYSSKVQLADGTWEKIGVLVRTRYDGYVRSLDTETGQIVKAKVVGWFNNGVSDTWRKVRLPATRKGKWGLLGPRFTTDHRLLCERGDVRVDAIQDSDRVATKERKFTVHQMQILLGSLLGDGGFQSRNGAGSTFSVGQVATRAVYAEWKAKSLFVSGYSLHYDRDNVQYVSETTNQISELHNNLSQYCDSTIRLRGAIPYPDLLCRLGPLGFAVWYMDDGTLVNGTSCRIACTVPMGIGEVAARHLSDRFGYVSYLAGQGSFCFSQVATTALHEFIRPYVHPIFAYKIVGSVADECPVLDTRGPTYFAPILEVVAAPSSRGTETIRYCLEVEGTHNFLTEIGFVRNCGDADATLRVYNKLYPMVAEDPKLLAHYECVTLPGLNAFASVELRGLRVDERAVDEFEVFMEQRVAEMEVSLLSQVPKSIKRKHAEKGIKFSRAEFTLDVLFRHPDGFKLKPKVFTKTTVKLDKARQIPSTSTKDHLPYFYDSCPFTYELSEYVKSARILGTNVKGFKAKYIIDGMVRPTYNLHKAVTGRSSSENPNGQNFPKRGPMASAYRKIFVAPPGYFLLEADLSQAELRIAGDMANDPTMIKIYREAGDIHTYTALIVLSTTMAQFRLLDKKEQKDARTKAKAVNFGFLYGMGWRKFIAYAKTQYGVEFTDKEAQRVRTDFFSRYSKLADWHATMRAYVKEWKQVRSYSGRLRHLPMIDSPDEMTASEAERAAINSPVQGFGSDLGIMACGRMDLEVNPRYLSLVGFVHDAIYAYVPKEYVEWGAKTLRWYMETNPLEEWFGRRMRVPIVADVGFGLNLSDIFEMGAFNVDENPTVGEYNFQALWADKPESAVTIPRQRIPLNNGRL